MDVEIRPFEARDEAGVIALWEAALPATRPWHEPAGIIRRKVAV